MYLLDAADIVKLFADLEFNIALHGHKHVPHIQRKSCTKNSARV